MNFRYDAKIKIISVVKILSTLVLLVIYNKNENAI